MVQTARSSAVKYDTSRGSEAGASLGLIGGLILGAMNLSAMAGGASIGAAQIGVVSFLIGVVGPPVLLTIGGAAVGWLAGGIIGSVRHSRWLEPYKSPTVPLDEPEMAAPSMPLEPVIDPEIEAMQAQARAFSGYGSSIEGRGFAQNELQRRLLADDELYLN